MRDSPRPLASSYFGIGNALNVRRALSQSLPSPSLAALFALATVLLAAFALLPSYALAQQAPGTPSSVSATRDDGTLDVSWAAVHDADSYNVNTTDDGGQSWVRVLNDVAGTSATISNVSNSAAYIVAVQAGNAHGVGGWRNSATIPPWNSPPPPRPSSVTVDRVDGTLEVSWAASNGADSYNVNTTDDDGKSWVRALSGVAGTGATIANVSNSATYIVAVQAQNANGLSGWRNSAPAPPSGPPPAAPVEILTSRICDHYFRIWWNPVPGATGYDLNWSVNGKKSWKRILTNENHTAWEAVKWNKNKTYHTAVRARNAYGESGWTNSAATPPGPCKPDAAQAVWTNDVINVSWTGGRRSAGYDLNVSDDNAKSWTRVASDLDAAEYAYSIADLDYSDRFIFAVRSRNGAMESDWTNSPTIAPSGPPRTLTSSNVKRTSATLTIANHSPAWWYKGDQSGAQCLPVPANTPTANASGLTADTAYVFTAYSDSQCSASIASASAFTTAKAGIAVSRITKTAAKLSIVGHEDPWWLKRTQPSGGACESQGSSKTKNLTGLDYGSTYTYKAYDDSACASEIAGETFQTDGFSVGNLGETADSTDCTPGYVNGAYRCAVRFATGGKSGGYTLESVTADFSAKNDSPSDIIVAVHRANSTNPANPADAAQVTLSGDNPISAGQQTYTCPASAGGNCDLAANTTYFVHISSAKSGSGYYNLKTTASDSGAAVPSDNGWSIADTGKWKFETLSWRDISDDSTPMLKIVALNPVARLSVARSGSTTANLVIENYTAAWWYKRTSPSGDDICRSVSAGTTSAGLTGIANNTAYTYKAYDKAGCGADDELATISFTPAPMYATGAAATTATLNLTGQSGNWYYKATVAPDDSCKGPVSATSKELRGLTTNTPYVYTAYSDSACSTGNSISSVSFTTWNPALSASGVTHNSAAITLSGWAAGTGTGKDGVWHHEATATPQNHWPYNRCSASHSGGGASLAGLKAGTTYTFTAYSDDQCNNAIATADSFTTPTPALSVDKFTFTGATLNISNHTDAWWYDRAAPAGDSTCRSATAGTTSAALSGLSNATSYTYKAYRLEGCNPAHEMASVSFTFTAPVLTVANIAPNSATLTIANYVNDWHYKATAAPHTSCSAAQTGTAANLASLSDNTEYTYTAYTDGACSNKITDNKFHTPFALASRDAGKDISTSTATNNKYPHSLWSDGTTLWVADFNASKIFAYNLATKLRDPDKDFDTLKAAGNSAPSGIWSDGVTMWVGDTWDAYIRAYKMSDKSRDYDKDFETLIAAGNTRPTGIASNGTTMWVLDHSDTKIYAYKMSDKSRDSGKDIIANTLDAAQNDKPYGLHISNGNLYVGDLDEDKIFAYSVSTRKWNIGKDFNTLKAAGNVNPRGIWSNGSTMWVSDDKLIFTNYGGGKIYAYNMSNKSRDSGKDFDISDLQNSTDFKPFGIWSNGATMWVVDDDDDTVKAYSLALESRDPSKDFNTLSAAGNTSPRGVWSNGSTMWVSDYADGKIYAYKMSDKSRDAGKDFNTLNAAGNDDPLGLWSDGTTMWAVEHSGLLSGVKVYAYNMSSKSRDSGKDFNFLGSSGNSNPYGILTNNATMWVTDYQDDKVYAYKRSDKTRDQDKDFNTLSAAGNANPYGLWANDVTMWVADYIDKKLYAYRAFRPYLTIGDITATSATLTFPDRTATWRYKATAAPDTSCSFAQTSPTVNLTGLTAGQSYTYKAYSDSGCATEIASETTFTTRSE